MISFQGVGLVGSSPLARGLPPWGLVGTSCPRIIPARAGFTTFRIVSSQAITDHPRSRGVYQAPMIEVDGDGGSSPLARGLLVLVLWGVCTRRIIPARAGFTLRASPCWRSGPDHPRSRGVYSTPWGGSHRSLGSSPLARGLHTAAYRDGYWEGIIPARAGFTVVVLPGGRGWRDHPRSRGVYVRRVMGAVVT